MNGIWLTLVFLVGLCSVSTEAIETPTPLDESALKDVHSNPSKKVFQCYWDAARGACENGKGGSTCKDGGQYGVCEGNSANSCHCSAF